MWATQQSNLARTKTVLLNLAKEFSDPQYYGTVTSLEILNEPAGYMNDQLKNTARSFSSELQLPCALRRCQRFRLTQSKPDDLYYTIRYPYGSSQESGLLVSSCFSPVHPSMVRCSSPMTFLFRNQVTYHDAFMPAVSSLPLDASVDRDREKLTRPTTLFATQSFWKGLFTYPKVNGIAVDMHHYEIFSCVSDTLRQFQSTRADRSRAHRPCLQGGRAPPHLLSASLEHVRVRK